MAYIAPVLCLMVLLAYPILGDFPAFKGSSEKHEVAQVFNSMDEDKNGFVSPQEHRDAARRAMEGKGDLGLNEEQQKYVMQKYDLNQDGSFSVEELDAMFAAIDANGDGKLTVKEMYTKMQG